MLYKRVFPSLRFRSKPHSYGKGTARTAWQSNAVSFASSVFGVVCDSYFIVNFSQILGDQSSETNGG
ncbi:MAG: hypothetical protein D6691_10230 [Candidatus Hydrogenedentota bacterium]|nr:MAG: hypothetical protein D6691_10230 [Candidatus Hydrogenedentota bacterium]